MIKKIAVIGATGMLGRPVAIALMEAGFEVTALVRNPQAARRVLPPEIAVVEADVRDEESLRTGMHGQDALYLSLSVAPGERRGDLHTEDQGLQLILGAARAEGIARIGYVSALVHDTSKSRWWVIDVWRRALARIKASGIAYTIFYPSNFMETLAQRHDAGSIMLLLGSSRRTAYWIAGKDYGRQVAKAFASDQAANREYAIQGPEPMTYDEAARRYARALRRSPRIVRVPFWVACFGSHFSREADFNLNVMRVVLGYREVFKARATWDELGQPTTTIETFVASA